jgi:hypothetical protein
LPTDEHARDEVARDRLDLGVELADVGVVVAPGGRDPVLGGGQFSLQRREVLVGLEVGVGLGDGDEPPRAWVSMPSDLACCRALAGSHRGAARLHDVFERASLVRGIPLDGLDEVADEVVATLELDVDLGHASCTRLRSLMRPL